MLLKIYLLNLFLISCFSQIWEFQNQSETNNVNSCIVKLINLIKGEEKSMDVTLVNNDESLSKDLNNMDGLKFLSLSFQWPHYHVYHAVYVINSKDCYELKVGIKNLKHDFFWNPKAIFIIAVENVGNDLKYLSRLLRFYNIFNVSVILDPDEDDEYSIFGFGSEIDACHRPAEKVLKEVTTCSEFRTDNIYKFNIPTVMRNCRAKILIREYWPFVTYSKNESKGVDQFVLQLWKDSKNVTMEIKNVGKDRPTESVLKTYPFVYHNQTVNYEGIMGGIVLEYNRTIDHDFSYPFVIDHNSILVARSSYYGKWEVIIKQMTELVSFLIFFVFAAFCILTTYLSIFKTQSKDVIRNIVIVYGYFLANIYVKRLNTSLVSRIVLINMLIFVFMMSNIVQAFLLSASTNPIRSSQIKDKLEIYKNYKPVIYIPWQHLFEYENLKPMDNCTTIPHCVDAVINNKDEKLFTIISDMFFNLAAWNMVDDNGMVRAYRLPDPPIMLFRITIFHQGSPFKDPFDRLMEMMLMGGLYNKHFKDTRDKAKRNSRLKDRPSYMPTKFSDVKEAFLILLVGYLVSSLVFLYERKSKKKSENN